MTSEEERAEIRRMQRINRIGKYTIACASIIAVIAIAYGLTR